MRPGLRAMRLLPIALSLFSGCTCSGPAPNQGASAGVPADKCEDYVAILSGRSRDPDSLDDPALQAFAQSNAYLVMCGAVLSDADELCVRLIPRGRGPTAVCRHMWSVFRELRSHPQGRAFMFDQVDWEECEPFPPLPTTYCDDFRQVMRSGDPAGCAKMAGSESICRAFLTLDKSLCRVEGELAEIEIEFADRKPGEPAKVKVKDALEDSCRRTIDSRAFLAKGLEEIATSGPPHEREFAKAALGRPDACASLAKTAMDTCQAGSAAARP